MKEQLIKMFPLRAYNPTGGNFSRNYVLIPTIIGIIIVTGFTITQIDNPQGLINLLWMVVPVSWFVFGMYWDSLGFNAYLINKFPSLYNKPEDEKWKDKSLY